MYEDYTPTDHCEPLTAAEQQLYTGVLLREHADIFHSDEEDITQNGHKIKRRIVLEWRAPHATRTLHTLDQLHAADSARRAVHLGVKPGDKLSPEHVALLMDKSWASYVDRCVLEGWQKLASVSETSFACSASEIFVLIASLCFASVL